MPIYEYRCEQGHNFEVTQSMSDDSITACTTCDAPVQRVFHPVAVHFKGSGFYSTDYGKKKKDGAAEAPKEDKKPGTSEKKSSDSSEKKSSDSSEKKSSDSPASSSSSAD